MNKLLSVKRAAQYVRDDTEVTYEVLLFDKIVAEIIYTQEGDLYTIDELYLVSDDIARSGDLHSEDDYAEFATLEEAVEHVEGLLLRTFASMRYALVDYAHDATVEEAYFAMLDKYRELSK